MLGIFLNSSGLGIHPQLAETAGGDLDVEVPLRSVAPRVDTLHEERRNSELSRQVQAGERAVWDSESEIRAEMRHEVSADELLFRDRVECHASIFDRP